MNRFLRWIQRRILGLPLPPAPVVPNPTRSLGAVDVRLAELQRKQSKQRQVLEERVAVILANVALANMRQDEVVRE